MILREDSALGKIKEILTGKLPPGLMVNHPTLGLILTTLPTLHPGTFFRLTLLTRFLEHILLIWSHQSFMQSQGSASHSSTSCMETAFAP